MRRHQIIAGKSAFVRLVAENFRGGALIVDGGRQLLPAAVESHISRATFARVEVEIKVSQLFATNAARAIEAEAEFLQQADRRTPVDKRVERYLEIVFFLTESDGPFQKQCADAAALKTAADPKPADLAISVVVMLHADHPDDLTRRRFRHPEVAARTFHINGLDVIHVVAGVIVGDAAAEQSILIKLATGCLISGFKTADIRGNGIIACHAAIVSCVRRFPVRVTFTNEATANLNFTLRERSKCPLSLSKFGDFYPTMMRSFREQPGGRWIVIFGH